jgi:glucose/arabinose dehydrogenase
VVGPDNNVYLIIGDVGGHMTQSENAIGGPLPDGTSGVLRVTQDGDAVVPNSPLGNDTDPTLNKYYAYGIRNSFGIDFDPVTGKLWDTENGPTFGDEINLVEPGFNSGWTKIQGSAQARQLNPANVLVNINGKGTYRDPEFVWNQPVGPTALKFLNSEKLGQQYQNDMFVGDIINGNLYNFKLNEQRTGLLVGKVATNPQEIAFGNGFGGITDIQVGPDGYLYVLSYSGAIYRIVLSSA